jgi:hypothetical protein
LVVFDPSFTVNEQDPAGRKFVSAYFLSVPHQLNRGPHEFHLPVLRVHCLLNVKGKLLKRFAHNPDREPSIACIFVQTARYLIALMHPFLAWLHYPIRYHDHRIIRLFIT